MYAKLKECPHCGSAAELEDHRTVWAVKCTSTACATIMLGERAPEPDGEMGIAYWEGIKQTAIDRWNARAIAPPVAAGSVDTILTSGFGVLMWKHVRTPLDQTVFAEIVSHINAWGAQQRMEGKREGADTVAMAEQMKLFRSAHDEACIELKERAEKAEANEIRLQQLVIEAQDRAEKAEARALTAEDKLSAANNMLIGVSAELKNAEARSAELQEALDVAMLVVSLHAQ